MVDDQTEASPPSEELDANLATESSTEAATDANAADSSTAETGEKSDGLLEAVMAAIEAPASDAPPASDAAVDGKSESEGAEGDDAEAEADESDPEIPKEFHEHPAWKRIHSRMTGYKGPAEQYQKIEKFMADNRLTPDEVVQGYQVMALMRNHPEKALEVLDGYRAQLAESIGAVLPDDLADKVRRGVTDEATARALAKAQATNTRTQADLDAQRQQQAAADLEATREAVRDSIGKWETRTRKFDPEYSQKEAMVQSEIRAIVQEIGQRPQTPEDGLVLAKAAYERVNKRIKSLLPARTNVVSHPSSPSATAATPQPETLGEAIREAVNVA